MHLSALQVEHSALQAMLNGPERPQNIPRKDKGKLSKKTKPLFGSAKQAIEQPSASHDAKSSAEAELEDENEDFETLR